MKRFMMSVSDEMYAWLEAEKNRRHLESIQETARFLLSERVGEKEAVLWREDDNFFISIPEHFVNHVEVNDVNKTLSFSGLVYGKRGTRLIEDLRRLAKAQELHKKHFSLILPGTFKGVVCFGDKVPLTKQKDDLVHFQITVYEVRGAS